jgi:hypothetical protein
LRRGTSQGVESVPVKDFPIHAAGRHTTLLRVFIYVFTLVAWLEYIYVYVYHYSIVLLCVDHCALPEKDLMRGPTVGGRYQSLL